MLGQIEGQEEKGVTDYEMVGRHHQRDGHVFAQTLRDSEGQRIEEAGTLQPWGRKELDNDLMTE